VKKVEMADHFRANGKIYVVIAVLVVILSGLFLYVARLDRKDQQIGEKRLNSHITGRPVVRPEKQCQME